MLMMLGFDRDLGVAGRAMVRTGDGSIVQKLLKIDRPSTLRLITCYHMMLTR